MEHANSDRTAGGVIPGFPAALPMALEDAWLALKRQSKHVEILIPRDGEVRILVRRNTRTVWTLIACCTVGTPCMLFGAWLFDRYQASPSFDLPVRYNLTLLYLMGWMAFGAGILLALINLATGGVSRDTTIDVSLGKLRIDHWIAGDHVVREYTPEEISLIWADSAIEIAARLGNFSLAPFAPTEVAVAAVEIIGVVFWGKRAGIARNVRSSAAAFGRMKVAIGPLPQDEDCSES